MYRLFVKRFLDILVSIIGLLITLPILIITYFILGFQNNWSVFFFQERPGIQQKAFRIIKFKTMTDAKDTEGKLLPDKQRITKAGKIIRRFSIDELPQLVNVLKGEMSLIGPRPLLFKYIPLYSVEQLRRHDVRPGITGLAQVNGRNSISWEQKFDYDIFYVDKLSFTLDIKILWKTFIKVIRTEGVNQSDDRPMQPFNGNNEKSMKQKLLIIGAGSVGKFIAYNINQFTNSFEIIGFLDDDTTKHNTVIADFKVLGAVEKLPEFSGKGIAIVWGIAFPVIKKKLFDQYQSLSFEFPNFIAKDAWVSEGVIFGKGCIIYPGTAINYETVIDDFVVINMNCSIGHNCTIQSFSSLAPGVNLGGNTNVGNCVEIGIGASTIQSTIIGDNATIGGQAMVVSDVSKLDVVVGIPAKSIK